MRPSISRTQGVRSTTQNRASRAERAWSLRASVAAVFCFALCAPFAASAQNEDDPFAGVEEMVVTGSNTAALLAPASTSAVAFDTADLDAYGVEDLGDIAAYVPNLEIRSQNATNASFFVRGVGLQDFGANASSSVPIFQDGVPRNPSATQLVGLFDIGGISVLKGPQGSGNYRNSSAGAFLIQAKKPEAEFSSFANISLYRIVSVDARDANRYDLETAVSAPVFDDWISVRLSARYSHENPFWENGCANRSAIADRDTLGGPNRVEDLQICGETTINGGERSQVKEFASKYIGEVDDFGFRGQIRFVPPDTPLDVTFRIELSRLNRDSTAGQHVAVGIPGNRDRLGGSDTLGYTDPDNVNRYNELLQYFTNTFPTRPPRFWEQSARRRVEKELLKRPLDEHPYRGDLDRPGRTILETYVASTTARLDFDAFDIDVNAGFIDYRKSEFRDTDLSPNVAFPSAGNDQAWEVYGDIKVSGDHILDFPLDWQVGGWAMTEQVEAFQQQVVFEDIRIVAYQQEIYTLGVFAEARYQFLESFTLAGGVRWNYERKDMELQGRRTQLDGTPLPIFNAGSRNQRSWEQLTGFGEIRYDFTEDIATYVKYSRGFKAGHFNPARPGLAKDIDRGFADPEQIDAFEWGLEFSTWASRINGNANFFYYIYKNYQVFRLTSTTEGIFQTIQNADRALNYGAELEVTVTPLEGFVPEEIEGLRINLRGGWLTTAYQEFANSEQRQIGQTQIGLTIDYSGNPLISAPQLQLAATFTWPVDLGRYGVITPQYDFTWSDDTPFGPNRGRGELDIFGESRFPPFLVGNRAFTLHNVRLTWEPPGATGLTLAGWCRNVTDERYLNFSVDISTFNSQFLNFVADPRTCGADVRFNF